MAQINTHQTNKYLLILSLIVAVVILGIILNRSKETQQLQSQAANNFHNLPQPSPIGPFPPKRVGGGGYKR